MNVLDLFSGIGGFSLGLERAGMRTVAFCEIEAHARARLRKHWPTVPIFDDVRTLTADRLRADGIVPNVICGGFPCQDISTAGSGDGLQGSRSGLFYEVARIVGEVGPDYVILENVSALLVRGLDEVLRTLATLGYDAEWHCIPASRVGAPHRRDRVWIVAHAQRIGLSGSGQLISSITTAPLAYREADRFVRAFHERRLPYVCGGHDGIPAYVDETALHGLGNAVVPQIPQIIGEAIMAHRNLT